MAKYFISGTSTGGSLAVEKHLGRYFRELYHHAVVTEESIESIKISLEAEQARYFDTHKGKRVNILFHKSYNEEVLFFQIGDMSYSFIRITREIL